MKGRLVAALTAFLLVLNLAATAGASSSGYNEAFANAHKSSPSTVDAAWSVTSTPWAQNVAIAQAHDCTGCGAGAAAFQIDLNGANVPTDTATASDPSCETCTAVAIADQWVVTDPGQRIVLTAAGQAALAQIGAQVTSWAGTNFGTLRQFLAATSYVYDEINGTLSQDVTTMSGSTSGITITQYGRSSHVGVAAP